MKTSRGGKARKWGRWVAGAGMLFFLAACGGGSGNGTATTPVSVRIGGTAAARSAAAIPVGVATVSFVISAVDMTTISLDLPVSGLASVSQSFSVPNGVDRQFLVEAKDSSGTVLYRGMSLVSLTGTPVDLAITISASNATATLVTDAGGVTTAPAVLSSATATVHIPAGTTLTDSAGTPVTGTLSATASFFTSSATLPATAQNVPGGTYLTAYLDMTIGTAASTVATMSPPLPVTMSAGSGASPGDVLSVYSYDAATGSWTPETTTTVRADGTVAFTVGHLSVWALFKQATSAVLTLSAAGVPAGNTIGGVQVLVNLPTGVTVLANAAGAVDPTVMAVSGGAPTGSSLAASYTPAGAGGLGNVMLSLISATPFPAGGFATLTCNIAAGATPRASDFTLGTVTVFDVNGVPFAGATGAVTVTFR